MAQPYANVVLGQLFVRRRLLRWRGLLRPPPGPPAGPDVAPPGPGAAGHGAARARDEQPAADAAGEPLARTRSEAELAAALAMSMEEAAPPPDHSDPSQDQGDPPPPDQEELEGVAQLAGMGFEPAAAARALRATGGDPALLTPAAAQGLSA